MPSDSTLQNQIEWIHCNSCLRNTQHNVIAHHEQFTSDRLYDHEGALTGNIWWQTNYDMLECRGCQTVALRRTHEFSESNEGEIETEFYPPQVSRQQPKWIEKLGYEFQDLLKEIYVALHADSRRLALMGARTVIDLLMLDKIGDVGSFAEKLKQLESNGYLGLKNREALEAALDAGNAAAHRGFMPASEQLSNVMDIVENLLQQIYVLEKAGKELKAATPPRPRK